MLIMSDDEKLVKSVTQMSSAQTHSSNVSPALHRCAVQTSQWFNPPTCCDGEMEGEISEDK